MRVSSTVLWEGGGEIPLPDPILLHSGGNRVPSLFSAGYLLGCSAGSREGKKQMT